MTDTRPRFPWWVVVGGLVLAAGYLPTLAAPFDFIDDGNLVYPAPAGTTLAGHAARWWDKVAANVEHLGPFRPTLWVHWEVLANVLGADPVAWRAARLLWCGLAAGGLLWLLRELNLHPGAAVVAGAAAMWNPYRNEIWTSLTLAEGVAMPYAMLALVAARKAAGTGRAWRWDAVVVGSLLIALGCKNTFVALVPALLALRLLPDGVTFRDGWRRGRWAAVAYLVPLALPAAHFVYFKLNWHPGQYETPGPSVAQAKQFASWMKGALGLDFLGAGMGLTGFALAFAGKTRKKVTRDKGQGTSSEPRPIGFSAFTCPLSLVPCPFTPKAALVAGALLFAAGTAVYLPLPMMAARYTMPAVWGADILFAVMLTGLAGLPGSLAKRAAWVGICGGLAAIAVANVGRQERVAARAGMLWQVAHELERTAPPGSRVMWVSGESSRGELNVEEGIH
ncbi:MAG: hypothetical protein ACRC7O_16465, partial [Fimbriiglobus sp.]